MGLSLNQQQKIIELAAQGKKPAEIAKELKHQESTVNKLLAKLAAESLANTGTAVATRDEGDLVVRQIANSEELIKAMTMDPQRGFQMGQGAGCTIAIVGEQLLRFFGGRGTDGERDSLFGTALGVASGIYQGSRAYHRVYPEEREERRKQSGKINVEEVVKAAIEARDAQDAHISKIVAKAVRNTLETLKEGEGGGEVE